MLEDGISRWSIDPGDYKLHRGIFNKIQEIFCPFLEPRVGMFASPCNHQLKHFVAKWPHHQAKACNALEVDLRPEIFHCCWENPPWTIISDWLSRLRENPQVRCQVAVPYWVGTSWWPQLVKMHKRQSPVILIHPREGLLTSCLGLRMPPTNWPLLCLLLSGKNYREGKFLLRDPKNLSNANIAGQIQRLALISPSEAKHAYSALLLIPGLESLIFSPLLKRCKRDWNASIAKYSDFWDAQEALNKLQTKWVKWASIQSVRDRLIIIMRIVHLYRSVDLAQTLRALSYQGEAS
jgi:hypothetical protein